MHKGRNKEALEMEYKILEDTDIQVRISGVVESSNPYSES